MVCYYYSITTNKNHFILNWDSVHYMILLYIEVKIILGGKKMKLNIFLKDYCSL